MSKKITPIQALENIKERLKQDDIIHLLDMCNLIVVEKALKALEIIKNKVAPLVNLDTIDIGDGSNKLKYRVYDNELYAYRPLTKEEYELLKEILKWQENLTVKQIRSGSGTIISVSPVASGIWKTTVVKDSTNVKDQKEGVK